MPALLPAPSASLPRSRPCACSLVQLPPHLPCQNIDACLTAMSVREVRQAMRRRRERCWVDIGGRQRRACCAGPNVPLPRPAHTLCLFRETRHIPFAPPEAHGILAALLPTACAAVAALLALPATSYQPAQPEQSGWQRARRADGSPPPPPPPVAAPPSAALHAAVRHGPAAQQGDCTAGGDQA